MTALAKLPTNDDVRVLGRGIARSVRALYAERCSPREIADALSVSMSYVSQCLRWKAGDSPLAMRRAA